MHSRRRTTLALALAAAGLLAAPASATADVTGTDLVTNGGFESPALSGGWGVFPAIDGWTATSGCGIEVQHDQSVAHGGYQFVELASNCPSAMATTLTTVPGWTYTVSYFYEPRPGNPFNDSPITSSWEGADLETNTGSANGAGWSERTHVVRASDDASVLAFRDGNASGTYGGLLDDVSVTPALSLCSLNQQGKAFKGGATAPVKVQLCDADGNNVSAADVTLHAGQPVRQDSSAAPVLDDSGAANSPTMDFRYDADLAGYIFNLSLKGYSTGTYTLPVTVSSGGGTYDVTFDVR